MNLATPFCDYDRMSTEIEVINTDNADLYGEIRAVLAEARSSVAQSVNVAMVHVYWHIGRLIDRHVSVGSRSKIYGAELLANGG
jgi:hypothetical protein